MIGHVHFIVGSESDLGMLLRERRMLFMEPERSDFKNMLILIHRDVAHKSCLTPLFEVEQCISWFKNQT